MVIVVLVCEGRLSLYDDVGVGGGMFVDVLPDIPMKLRFSAVMFGGGLWGWWWVMRVFFSGVSIRVGCSLMCG